MRRRASLRRFVTALLLIGLLTACGSHQTDRPDARTGLTVGATADAGSMVLANLYAAALRYFGSAAQVEVVADPLAALDSGQLDVVPGFTGRLLQTFASGTSSGYGDEQVYRTLLGTLPEGITAGDYTTAAEDKPAAAVTGLGLVQVPRAELRSNEASARSVKWVYILLAIVLLALSSRKRAGAPPHSVLLPGVPGKKWLQEAFYSSTKHVTCLLSPLQSRTVRRLSQGGCRRPPASC